MELETQRWRSLAKLWLLRLRLRIRGLQYTETPESEVDPELLRRIDVCWSVVVGSGCWSLAEELGSAWRC